MDHPTLQGKQQIQVSNDTLLSVESVEHEDHPQEKNPAHLWLHSQLKSHVTWLHSPLGTPHCQEQPWQGRPGRNTGCGKSQLAWLACCDGDFKRLERSVNSPPLAVMSWEAKINFHQIWMIFFKKQQHFNHGRKKTFSLKDQFIFLAYFWHFKVIVIVQGGCWFQRAYGQEV